MPIIAADVLLVFTTSTLFTTTVSGCEPEDGPGDIESDYGGKLVLLGCSVKNGVGDFVHLKEVFLTLLEEKKLLHLGIFVEDTRENGLGLFLQLLKDISGTGDSSLNTITSHLKTIVLIYKLNVRNPSATTKEKYETVLLPEIERIRMLNSNRDVKETQLFLSTHSSSISTTSIPNFLTDVETSLKSRFEFNAVERFGISCSPDEFGACGLCEYGRDPSQEGAGMGLAPLGSSKFGIRTLKSLPGVETTSWYWDKMKNDALEECGILPYKFKSDHGEIWINDWRELQRHTGSDFVTVDFAAEDLESKEANFAMLQTWLFIVITEIFRDKVELSLNSDSKFDQPRLDILLKSQWLIDTLDVSTFIGPLRYEVRNRLEPMLQSAFGSKSKILLKIMEADHKIT